MGLENLLEREGMSNYSSQSCCNSKSMNKSAEKSSDSVLDEGKLEVPANKTHEESKVVEPVMKTISKKFMSKVSCQRRKHTNLVHQHSKKCEDHSSSYCHG